MLTFISVYPTFGLFCIEQTAVTKFQLKVDHTATPCTILLY